MRKFSDKIYCFSPAVMALTFLFEVVAAALAIFKYKSSPTRNLIIYLLLALAGFQLAEFMVCGGFGFSGVEWARFGYVSITLLPPMGLHLAHKIAGRKSGNLVKIAYLTCVIFIVYYVFATYGVSAKYCRPNYSVFNVPHLWIEAFVLYYYGWMIAAVIFCYQQIKRLSGEIRGNFWAIIFKRSRFFTDVISGEKLRQISALKWLLGGYLAFMLPTTFVNIVNPATIEGIPSIMCGFAVLMAITLIGFVAPRVLEKK